MLKNAQYFRNYKIFIFKPTVYEYEIYRWSINYLSHKINILSLKYSKLLIFPRKKQRIFDEKLYFIV